MRHYEIVFIVDPVLSGDEVKATANMYLNQLKAEGCTIVHENEWGLRQLAYPINKRTNGVYFVYEISCENGNFINKLEIAFRRDERVLRFLTLSLDKFAVQYNEDKRAGKIGGKRKAAMKKLAQEEEDGIELKKELAAANDLAIKNAEAATKAAAAEIEDIEVPAILNDVDGDAEENA